jgi:hypothetical protein
MGRRGGLPTAVLLAWCTAAGYHVRFGAALHGRRCGRPCFRFAGSDLMCCPSPPRPPFVWFHPCRVSPPWFPGHTLRPDNLWGSFGSPVSCRDPGLFHGLIRPVPTSPRPKLCTLWQPTKLRMAARFPVFSLGNKSTTHWLGTVSPCTCEPHGSSSSPRDAAEAPPPLAQVLQLRRRAPSKSRWGSAPASRRRRPGISSTTRRHPIALCPSIPSPLPRLPVSYAISLFWSSQQWAQPLFSRQQCLLLRFWVSWPSLFTGCSSRSGA